ncbi:hypothetical protein CLV48_101738 [Cecembia rubra]|uniref:Uncharacterized protein n=1 Tax=Cecembia rubra TaxID=1485585 RepID=A0A2P8EEA7_9BACT|nr:hypothetical protein CLV48_101738 [Cecembia rubra]
MKKRLSIKWTASFFQAGISVLIFIAKFQAIHLTNDTASL